jgi:hypothetical protein
MLPVKINNKNTSLGITSGLFSRPKGENLLACILLSEEKIMHLPISYSGRG